MTEDTPMFTEERRAMIVRLLETRDDGLPVASRRVEEVSGFVHSDPENRESCPDCLANDRAIYGCETCGGSGWMARPRNRDPYMSDKIMPGGFDPTKHDAARARDRQIEELNRQLARPRTEADLLDEANRHPYGWELARRRMYRDFDYGSLDAALEQLRLLDELASRLLHQVYVYAWLTHITPAVESLCDRGLRFLSDRLPERLRAPGAAPSLHVEGRVERSAGTRALQLRDEQMRQLAARGSTVSELCEHFGVSKSTVYAVVNRAA